MGIKVQFGEEDWARIEGAWTAWWEGELERPLVMIEDLQPPPEEWLPVLERIRDRGKLCQLYVSPEGARTINRELGGRGFAFYVLQPMSQAEAESFLQVIEHEE